MSQGSRAGQSWDGVPEEEGSSEETKHGDVEAEAQLRSEKVVLALVANTVADWGFFEMDDFLG